MTRTAELEQQIAELRRTLAAMQAGADTADAARACWFTTNTLITAQNLGDARRSGALTKWKRIGGRYVHSKSEVRAKWPDLWKHPRSGKAPEML